MAHTSENTTGYITLAATATAIALGVRVKIDSAGAVSAAGITDHWIGVTTHYVAASGNAVIKLRGTPGTLMLATAGAVTVGNRLWAAASGLVDDAQTAGPDTGYIARSASGASGDVIEAVPAGNNAIVGVISFPVTLSSMTAADVVTAWPTTFAGTLTAFDFIQGVPVTTGSKLATVTPKINSTSTTGGAIALTSATCTPLGKVLSSTAITAANVFASGDTISLVATSVTAFVEGTGVFLLTYVRN